MGGGWLHKPAFPPRTEAKDLWRRAYLASEVGDCGQTDRVEEVVACVEGDVEQGESGCDAQPEQHGATEES